MGCSHVSTIVSMFDQITLIEIEEAFARRPLPILDCSAASLVAELIMKLNETDPCNYCLFFNFRNVCM